MNIEQQFHEFLLEKFQEAKNAGATGELSITVRLSGYLNSKEAKITSEVSCGEWGDRGEMKARTIEAAFPIAISRATENRVHAPKLLTVEYA